jgi:putative DNA primase/helicase
MQDDLRAQVSILRVFAAAGVELRHMCDDEWMGCCPFHDDSTASFSVNSSKGVYVCFGCDAKGDAYTFLQEKEGLDFAGAKRRLAEIGGIDLAGTAPRKAENSPVEGAGKVVSIGAAAGLTEKPKDVAYYGYTDERERLLYEIVRREWLRDGARQKTFLQRYRDPEKPNEYIWRKHSRQVLYRLHKVAPADVVWLVEGEKDVHTLEKLGLVATTWAGGAKAKWLAGYSQTLAGKKIYIIPDNDEAGVSCMQKCFDKLSEIANVLVVRVPGPPKSDVTDWLNDGGTIEQLMELARKAEADAAETKRAGMVGAKREPNELAKEIMRDRYFLSDQDGAIYEYNSRYWERITTLRLKLFGLKVDSDQHTNQRRRGEIADYIATSVQQPRINWRQLTATEVPLQNGVFDVRALSMRPHRPEDYLETVVPIPYTEQADCPTWRRALIDYFGSDSDCELKVLALQQFFGYTLLPHARYKKALVLYGEGDTGKSQVLNLLGELVGQENRCAVSVEDMDDPRKRVPIRGKMLNMLTELSSKSVVADSGFKQLISTEEPLLFDPKHLPPYMYTPTCKHVIACNALPSVNDLTKATYNRMLIVRFNRVLKKEEQDRDFFGKLKAELPGILNWAIAGALDLVEHGGQFVEIPESSAIVDEYRRDENEINAFLDERCERDPEAWVTSEQVRSKFRTWAGRNYSDKAIGHMMRAAGFPSRQYRGENTRRHNGLRWRDALVSG